ncbi:MAG: hypothetical protein LC803_09825, partial [Acidobacteria bacterium]|nr:hypothetical protein [Acidobacteriota bacterium]
MNSVNPPRPPVSFPSGTMSKSLFTNRAPLRRALLRTFVVALPFLLLALPLSRDPYASAAGNPGDLDPAFGNGGKVVTPFPNGRDNTEDVAVQADGKVVVAGSSGSDFALARYNTDGSLDGTFGVGGRVHTDFPLDRGGFASALVIQPDGKIVAAGEATNATQSFASGFALARYNTDGSLDTTFDTDGLVITSFPGGSAFAEDLVLQPDGKLVAAGTRRDSTTFQAVLALARYNTDGSLDASFDSDGRATVDIADTTAEEAQGVAVQADGRIVVVGNGNSVFAVARVNANGSPDNTFDTDGQAFTDFGESFEQANAVAIQTDGRIVVAGEVATSLVDDDNFALARYNADGSPDNSFDGDGKVTTDFDLVDGAHDVVIQPDGRIIAAGRAGTFAGGTFFALARYNTTGALDTSFDGDGKVLTDVSGRRFNLGGRGIVLYTDGRIVVAGGENSSGQLDFGIVRYNPTGAPDTTFDGDGKAITDFPLNEETITDMAVQPDGKIVAVGHMNPRLIIIETQDFNFLLARYNPDGSFDTSFGSGGLVSTDFTGNGDDFAHAVVVQPDGKIVVAGQTGGRFSITPSADTSFAVARYNANGTLDETFGTGGKATINFTGGHDVAHAVAVQADGKIVLAGTDFRDFELARLNPDGSLDSGGAEDTTPGNSFGTGGRVVTDITETNNRFDSASALVIQPDGQIVVAGSTSAGFETSGDFAVVRYNVNGTFDTSFGNNGRVITDFASTADELSALIRQPDGKLLAAGSATVSGNNDFALARYNPDGSLDSGGAEDTTPGDSFGTGGKVTTDFGGFDPANDIALQADGRIVAVGLHFPLSIGVAAGVSSTHRAGYNVCDSPHEAAKFGQPSSHAATLCDQAKPATHGAVPVFAVARYEINGSLDNSFDGDGKVTTDFFGVDDEAFAVIIQADGKIVAGGYTDDGSSRDFALARYLAAPPATPTPTPTPTATPTPTPTPRVVQFSQSAQTVSEGATSITITVSRSGDTAAASNVDYATAADAAFTG